MDRSTNATLQWMDENVSVKVKLSVIPIVFSYPNDHSPCDGLSIVDSKTSSKPRCQYRVGNPAYPAGYCHFIRTR